MSHIKLSVDEFVLHVHSFMLSKSNLNCFWAALNVFFITMATVSGPTPPGTGV